MSRRRSTFLVTGGLSVHTSVAGGVDERTDIHAAVHAAAVEREGRIVETTSRDLVAAFPTPAAALDCALALQHQLLGEGHAPTWDGRLGIEIAAAETEAAYDDAIAEARRLRETAEPRGIRISPKVYEASRGRLGLEWEQSESSPTTGSPRGESVPKHGVIVSTPHVPHSTPRRRGAPSPAQRHANRVAASAALMLAAVSAAGFLFSNHPTSAPARSGGTSWEPLTVYVHQVRVGGLAFPYPFSRQDRARILLRIGVTNRTDREVQLRREDFRLEIGGREVAALPPLGWNTSHDDTILYMSVGPQAARHEFRFDRQPLLPGGSALVGLQFDFPLDTLQADELAPHRERRWHPFARWTTGMIVERLGSDAPGLQYRGPAGRTRADLTGDPFGLPAPVGQPSLLGGDVAVYQTRQPVHAFNAHKVWRFVEQQLVRDSRPIVVDMRRWPSPDPAVRAFLESRVDRYIRSQVAFVADGSPDGNLRFAYDPRERDAPQVWFAREADAAAALIGRTARDLAQLRKALRSPQDEIREAAVRALARKESGPSVNLVTERLLTDPAPAVRAAAARALADRRTKQLGMIHALSRAAADPEFPVRDAAFAALVRWEEWQAGRSAALREIERPHPSRYAIRIVGGGRIKAAYPRVLELVSDSSLTFEATRALAEIGDANAVPVLLNVLSSQRVGQEEILRALGRLATGPQRETALQVLADAFERDSAIPVRQAVMDAAGSLGGPEAIALALRGLGDKEFPVRQSAARALGVLRVEAAVGALEQRLADPPVARHAAEALRSIHSTAAHDALRRTIQRGDPLARGAAEPILATWDK